jgi:phosphoribosylpyrophosphate synthetase
LDGGFRSYDKYILLGCKEFYPIIDNIIKKDGPITLNGSSINLDASDADIDSIEQEYFSKFLKDIDPNLKPQEATLEHKLNFLRKRNCVETNNFFRGFINWRSYNDGTPDIKMNSSTVSKLRGAKIIYFAYFSFNESEVTSIMDQMLFLNSLNHYGVFEINVVLPYFPLGTMERIVGEGEIPTGYALANMLNSIPSGASKNNIYIFDIHALCSRFFFHTNSIPVLITLMPDYLSHITTTYPDATNLNFIVFPDDGAKKRFEKLIPSTFNKIVCNKTRVGNDRFIKIESGMDNLTEGTPLRLKTGKQINMFIVDDLVQSGGTLTETVSGIIQFLQKECPGDTNISAIKFNTLVTHSVYPTNANLVNFFSEPKKINKLITSNSRPVRSNYIEKTFRDKVSVIDIGSVLHKIFTNTENFTEYIAPYSIN